MKICDRFGKKLYSDNCNELADTVWNALRKKVSLKRADLSKANLYGRRQTAFERRLAEQRKDPAFDKLYRKARAEIDATDKIIRALDAANLRGASLTGADLRGTCLDPTAPWFSVADTDCHPGLYLAAAVKWLEENGYKGPFVMVKALKSETIKAGEKYRCKRFWVL